MFKTKNKIMLPMWHAMYMRQMMKHFRIFCSLITKYISFSLPLSVDQHIASLASCSWFKHMTQNDFGGLWCSGIYGTFVCRIPSAVQQPCRFSDRACLTGPGFMKEIIQNSVIIFPWQLHYHLVLCLYRENGCAGVCTRV